MPKYEITGPDGGTYEITAPEGASEEEILSYVQEQVAQPMSSVARTAIAPAVGVMSALSGSQQQLLNFAKAVRDVWKGGEGARDLTGTIAGTAALEPAAGLAGIAGTAIGGAEVGADTVEAVKGLAPELGPEGAAAARTVGGYVPEAVKGTLEMAPGVIDEYADTAADVGGPLAGAAVKTLPTAAAIGAGTHVIAPAAKIAGRGAAALANYRTPKTIATTKQLMAGGDDAVLAGKRLATTGETFSRQPPQGRFFPTGQQPPRIGLPPNRPTGAPGLVTDHLEKAAIKQGFDPGVIAALKNAKKADRFKLSQMVHIMKRIQENKRFGTTNRPTDVVGDSVMARFRVVRNANQSAAKQLDKVANDLKSLNVDYEPAVMEFLGDLKKLRISQNPQTLKLDFSKSNIEAATGAKRTLNKIIQRMRESDASTAYEVHHLKKFLDETVAYGKTAKGGLSGQTERIVKKLRHNLNEALRAKSPEYKAVNQKFAETKDVLDELQAVAGRQIDLMAPGADKAIGTHMRGVLSNRQSRVRLNNSVEALEALARKYHDPKAIVPRGTKAPKSGTVQDDLMVQILFADELDNVFGVVAPSSLAGETGKAVRGAANAVSSKAGAAEAALGLAEKAANKARGINREAAFKAIENLLRN